MTKITSKKLSNETAGLIINWATAADKADATAQKEENSRTIMLDALIADGINNPDYLKGAGKGKENTPLYNSITAALVVTLPKARQKSLTDNIETMTKKQKAYRRESMQRLGSRMGKLRKALEKRLAPARTRTPGGATNQSNKANTNAPTNITSSTPLKKFIETLSTGHSIINRVPGDQLPPEKSTEVQKLLDDLIAKLSAIKGK